MRRPTGRRPRGGPRTRWRDSVSRLIGERLSVPEELEDVERGVSVCVETPPPEPERDDQVYEEGRGLVDVIGVLQPQHPEQPRFTVGILSNIPARLDSQRNTRRNFVCCELTRTGN